MVRRSVFPLTLATLALLGARAANADAITLTGNASQDFNPNTNPSVQVLPIDSNPLQTIAETPVMEQNNMITGWAVKDLRLAYNSSTDTMYVGVNSYGISGDADGNGNPGTVSPAVQAQDPGFQDLANFGGSKSITVAFAAANPSNPNQPGAPIAVAGVPATKSEAGSGTDGFNVASYNPNGGGIQSNYGSTLTGHVGSLAFNPSATNPDFEFTINNFSTIPGLNPSQGFWVELYSGSADDGGVGEQTTSWIHVPAFAAETIPEPTTWMAWALAVGGGAVWQRRRKSTR
jgi:hypothetical protein